MIGKPNVIGSEILKIAGINAIFEIFLAAVLLENKITASTGATEHEPAAIVEKFINKVE